MLSFILKRLLYGFWVVVGVIIVVFMLFYVLPGDPVSSIVGQSTDSTTRANISKELGLDQPIPVQLAYYLNDLSPIAIHGDSPENAKKYEYAKVIDFGQNTLVLKFPYLGRSYQSHKKVDEMLYEGLGGTLLLAIVAMLFATFWGIILGMIAAIKQNTWIDYYIVTITVLGISIPSFVSALLISTAFGYYLGEYTGLPHQGSLWVNKPFVGWQMELKNLILPAFTLALRPLSIIVQLTRSSMIEVLSQDYIRTARAKGLGFYKILYKHVLKNGLNPVITAVSGWLASLMAGAFFIEYVFGWKGIGKMTIDAVLTQDLPVIMGSTIVVAMIFVVVNIFVDILYAVTDPRIRLKS